MPLSRPELLPNLPDSAWVDTTSGNPGFTPGSKARALSGVQFSFLNLQYPQCPFLHLLLPPDTLTMSYQKRVTTYETRGAWIEEHWGHDELDEITGSGTSMIFSYLRKTVLPTSQYNDVNSPRTAPEEYVWMLPTGTERNRMTTMGAVNLQQWLQLYLNNGAMYNPKGQIDRFNGIALFWGPDVFAGYFQAFSIDEDAEKPWQKTYNFSFKVIRSIISRVVGGSIE